MPNLYSNILSFLLPLLLLLPNTVLGLGFTIPPIKEGDVSKYSSKQYLFNCVSYPTIKDDILLVRIKSGDKLASQKLNLNIFDDDNNRLRSQLDISNDISLMFTNLNNPIKISQDLSGDNQDHLSFQDSANQVIEQIKRSSNRLFGHEDEEHVSNEKRDENFNKDFDRAKADELINNSQGKSLIYICFDNLYADKSWSFVAKPRDVELFVDIKNMTTIKQTNYNNFVQYFRRFKEQESKREQGSDDDGAKEPSQSQSSKSVKDKPFTQEDFENEIQYLKTELDSIVGNLDNSEIILQSLMEQEFKLRDVNEEIFSDYTKNSIILITCIICFGIVQTIYFKCYLRRKKVLSY
ncbi:uncharacterized protein RJT21DRAFT_113516 [Scheffersomyces amazonensis]|uniref:uncharacterized protein n=1 Tax=Scheffersomyces amazonensis TaxID=1078765 RepID=UPI00315CC487